MKSREIIIMLYLKYNGNWDKIYECILKRKVFKKSTIQKYLKEVNIKDFVTIIDDSYPNILKQISKPPFVVYKKDLDVMIGLATIVNNYERYMNYETE